ncbi:MAG: DUF5677 domain-containing protein [Planctomycetota bacterium]
MSIPNEDRKLNEIGARLEQLFNISNAILEHCVKTITLYEPGLAVSEINDEPVRYRVSHAICAKACKSFRASIVLAGIGAGEELKVVSRTLFETFVAANFVLRERLFISNAIGELSAEFRAKLYLAHGILKRYDKMEELKASSQFDSSVPNESVIRTEAEAATADIGEEWARRLRRRPRTYSSLSLRDLVDRFDEPAYAHWYGFIYSEQSQHVHASDPTSHIKYDEAESRFVVDWFPPIRDIGLSLAVNGILLGGCFLHLNEYCRFEAAVNDELSHLISEMHAFTDQPGT